MTDRAHRRVLAATCQVHPGSAGFTNLVVTRESGHIVFDPHADRSCVISVDEAAAHPLGIILGHLARRQIARTGENGRGFATADW